MIGNYGEVWQADGAGYWAIIYSQRIARKYLPHGAWPTVMDEEILVSFGSADLSIWVKRLLIPKKSKTQINLAIEIKSITTNHPERN